MFDYCDQCNHACLRYPLLKIKKITSHDEKRELGLSRRVVPSMIINNFLSWIVNLTVVAVILETEIWLSNHPKKKKFWTKSFFSLAFSMGQNHEKIVCNSSIAENYNVASG